MKLFRRMVLGVFALLAALVAAGTVIVMSTDTRQVADYLAERVMAETGRELIIAGDISLELSLVPIVVVEDVSFANAPWGARAEMVRLRRLKVSLDLLPLLRQEIRFAEIVLVEPDILLEIHADGRGNWQFTDAGSASDEPFEPTVVDRVSIERGRFNYVDHRSGRREELLLDRLDIQADPEEDTTRIDMTMGVGGETFTAGGEITSIYRLVRDPARLHARMVATGLGATADIQGMVTMPLDDPRFDVDVSLQSTDSGELAGRALRVLKLYPNLEVPALGALAARFKISGTPEALSLTGLSASIGPAGGNFLGASGDIRDLTGTPRLSLNLGGAIKRPSTFSGIVGHPLPDHTPFKFIGHFSNAEGGFAVERLSMTYGVSNVVGAAQVSFDGGRPVVVADLSSEAIFVDELLVLGGVADGTATRSPADGRVIPDTPIDVSALGAADVTLRFVTNALKVGDARFAGLDMSLLLDKGDLAVDLTKLGLGGGVLSGKARLDVRASPPRLLGQVGLNGARAEQLLAYATEVEILNGPVDADIRFEARGATVRQLAATLNGKSEIVMGEGSVASRYVELFGADLLREVMPWARHAQDTKVNCLVSRFHFKDGLATSTGMLFDTSKITITGGGTVDLASEKLNLRINPKPKEKTLISLAFPVDIKGTMANPSAAPTPSAVVKGVAGLALGLVNPLALLVVTASAGSEGKNDCVAALDRATSGDLVGQDTPMKQDDGPVDRVIEGVERGLEDVGKGISGAIKGLFGGRN